MIPFCKQNKVVVTDISNTKTDKVTKLTRAIDSIYGKFHFLNIVCNVSDTAPTTPIFETNLKPGFTTNLNACSDTGEVYRCLMDMSGKIFIMDKYISNNSLIGINGVVIS